jgi:hypothetical protein
VDSAVAVEVVSNRVVTVLASREIVVVSDTTIDDVSVRLVTTGAVEVLSHSKTRDTYPCEEPISENSFKLET